MKWLENAERFFSYDPVGDKYYFIFDDVKRGGKYTLMRYSEGIFTIHGQGDSYCDETEKQLSFDEVCTLIWKNRKYVHKEMVR